MAQKYDSLIETVFSEAPKVDRENGIIRGVKILGRQSKNQGGSREYSTSAMQEAARMYEGLGVNVNHPEDRTSVVDRPVQDGYGWLEGVQVKEDGVYGDLHYLKSHPQAEMIAEAAERRPNRFGLSHNGLGKVVRQGDKNIVESIASMRSVDIVQTPATNTGLFESEENPEPEQEKRTMLKLKECVGRIDKAHAHKPLLTALIEMDEMSAYADAPMEEPAAELSADDQVSAAFKAMIVAVLDDTSLDVAGKAGRIKEILVAQEKLLAPDEPVVDETPVPADAAVAESHRKARETAASELLEAADVKPLPWQVKALSLLTESADRKAFVASQKTPATVEKVPVKKPAFSKPLQESVSDEYPKDHKSFLRRVGAKVPV